MQGWKSLGKHKNVLVTDPLCKNTKQKHQNTKLLEYSTTFKWKYSVILLTESEWEPSLFKSESVANMGQHIGF